MTNFPNRMKLAIDNFVTQWEMGFVKPVDVSGTVTPFDCDPQTKHKWLDELEHRLDDGCFDIQLTDETGSHVSHTCIRRMLFQNPYEYEKKLWNNWEEVRGALMRCREDGDGAAVQRDLTYLERVYPLEVSEIKRGAG